MDQQLLTDIQLSIKNGVVFPGVHTLAQHDQSVYIRNQEEELYLKSRDGKLLITYYSINTVVTQTIWTVQEARQIGKTFDFGQLSEPYLEAFKKAIELAGLLCLVGSGQVAILDSRKLTEPRWSRKRRIKNS